MQKKRKRRDVFWLLAGNFLLAFGVGCFILPNSILSGGTAGIAVALVPLFHINPVLCVDILNIALFLLGWLCLGRAFARRTLVSSILYPVLLSVISWMMEHYAPDVFVMEPILAALWGGVLTGMGLGMVFHTGASTGGMDIPALILHRTAHLPQGTCVALVDGLTVLLGIYAYGLSAALTGLIAVAASSLAISRMILLGLEPAVNVLIISPEWEAIRDFCMEKMERGVTILEARGGYTSRNSPVVMCVVNKKQFPLLEQGILEQDPGAFIIVQNVDSVHGLGFSRKEEII